MKQKLYQLQLKLYLLILQANIMDILMPHLNTMTYFITTILQHVLF
jgi:hypothetical protein